MKNDMSLSAAFGVLGFILASFAAYLTHIVWVISTLTGEAAVTTAQIVMSLLGTFVAPVGVIHGVMIWLGYGV